MAEVLLTLEHDQLRDFKRLVVVKRVIPALESEDPYFIQMFLDEARLGARLNHPNIVQTYDVGEHEGSPYLAIEFLEGQSLHVLQRRLHALGRKIPLDVGLRVLCDVLEGLHYAHELKDFDGKPLGVIHRDVTPSNIFVKYDGLTKLVDFGIARSATQREKTRAGMLKGKMSYMAPEQLKDEAITASVDVWAMGIVVWETLAGERLFRGKNDFETVQAVMRREIPKLSSKRDDVPAGLDEAVGMALQRDPAKRYKTAEEFKNALEDVAVTMGKPLRRSAVAALMNEVMAEAIEQNKKLIKDFFERAQPLGGSGAYLHVSASGALELRKESESPSGQDVSGTREHSGTHTGTPSVSVSLPRASTPARGSIRAPSMEASVPPGDEAPKTSQTVMVEMTEDPDEEPPRPMWHWGALLGVLGALGAVVWKVLG